MINISKQNPQSTTSMKNKWIDGFTLSILLTTLFGSITANPVDTEQLQLKGTLKRNGAEIEMFNHTLKNLVILSHLKSSTYDFLAPFTLLYTGTPAPGIDTFIVPLRFDFGGPLNLIASDEFVLEWTLNQGFFNASANLDMNACYIAMDETETSEIEFFVPITRSKVIEGTQDNPTYSLGDNITTIILANYDKTSFNLADRVIKTVRLKSDKLNKNDSFDELITKAISYYSTPNEMASRLQNWIIYNGADELDNVDLNISTNPSNVTSSKNYILWRTFYTDNWLVTRAMALKEQSEIKADKKGSFNPSLLESQNV